MSRKIVAPQRRKQIADALFLCLAESGHETVTIKDIARRANLHYGVIHYYFKSKDEIVSEMADSIIAKYGNLLLERTRSAHSATEKINIAVDFLVEEFIFNRRLNRVFYNLVQMAFERETIRDALRRQLRAYRRHIAAVIAEGTTNGEFPARRSGPIASSLVALVEGMALQWVIDSRALERKEVHSLIREMVDHYLFGH
ncbi:MAG: TetR family transcriptional regulator [Candidatus Abyssobacteria bacterium SURF_5]|uniref:TetR family transcriptional regulator n=1 Tax=Abyssobacteria bacterium (strain SURF_5) TaxID=2093360 RepID=A0A3A4PAB3_ABYX5|nr:MAG: TetR family transcriptional regulator [Candidatus Abyssubacteria bacterium SURF_5]